MDETNPIETGDDQGSRSAGSKDHKVSVMTNQRGDQTENDLSQVQEKTSKASPAETSPHNPSWIIKIIEDMARECESQGSSKMPKVPEKLRNSKNEESYRPLLVSIGPYHNPYEQSEYGKKFKTEKEPLNDGEKLKADMTLQFVNDIRKMKVEEAKKAKESYDENSVKSIIDENISKKIEEVAEKAKGFYDEDLVSSFGKDDSGNDNFTKMISIDGCFVVHFIYYFTREYDKLEMSDHKAALVKRDLLLLENQLPYVVLDSLRKLRFGEDKEKNMFDDFLQIRKTQESSSVWVRLGYYFLIFIIIISCCCCCCCFICSRGHPLPQSPPEEKKDSFITKINKKKKDATGGEQQLPAHLLELLYPRYIPAGNDDNGVGADPPKGNRCHYLYYSAKELKKVGIRFRPSRSDALTDIKFGSIIFPGTLELPPINIDKYTKSKLLNLVAYESSAVSKEKHLSAVTKKKRWVASYICFMDSLINDAEDVKELRSKGIINNYRGSDKDVADIFNNMSCSLEPETSAYKDVKKKINAQCESVYSKWVGQWVQDYFSSPWAFLALVGAVLTIFLTAVATYVAIWPID